MARKAGAATGLEKSEKRGVQAARNGPSEDRKCWQRMSWVSMARKAGAATGIENEEACTRRAGETMASPQAIAALRVQAS